MPKPTDSLQARAISKTFAGVQALQSVDLKVTQGEVLGLIGPNGSGKTTLINILSGFLRPSTGEVKHGPVDISGLPPFRIARQGICRTFQNVRLFRRLTALENVEVGASGGRRPARGARARARARSVLQSLGVGHLSDRVASELPYGVQRRVDIARAFAAEPEFLLLDEPAAGLSDAETSDLRESIAWIGSSTGIGILVIDHDLRLITELCDHIVVLDSGRVISTGTPDEITSDRAVIDAYLGTHVNDNDAPAAPEA